MRILEKESLYLSGPIIIPPASMYFLNYILYEIIYHLLLEKKLIRERDLEEREQFQMKSLR